MEALAIALYPNLNETIAFMMTGFVVVLGVLWTMSLATSLMSLPFKLAEKRAAKKAAEAAAQSASRQKQADEKSAELAGVISSAVYAAMDGAPHRIVSVKPSSEGEPAELVAVIAAAAAVAIGAPCRVCGITRVAPDFNWASSGRSAIFESHKR